MGSFYRNHSKSLTIFHVNLENKPAFLFSIILKISPILDFESVSEEFARFLGSPHIWKRFTSVSQHRLISISVRINAQMLVLLQHDRIYGLLLHSQFGR